MEVNKIYNENCMDTVRRMPDGFLNCVVTSPPYFGLRDYGNDDQFGLEETPEAYVQNLVDLFREIRRALRDDGTVWLNLGDSYGGIAGNTRGAGAGGGKKRGEAMLGGAIGRDKGGRSKDLLGIPWRVAFALQADGWYLRQDIIWHKPNPMPESVTDRCTKGHEYIFMLTKSAKYYYDSEAVKEKSVSLPNTAGTWDGNTDFKLPNGNTRFAKPNLGGSIDGNRNKRSVWTVNTKPYSEAHFATYPEALIVPCIKAGCPEKVCLKCGAPHERVVKKKRMSRTEFEKDDPRYRPNKYKGSYDDINGKGDAGYTITETIGIEPACNCGGHRAPGIVYDPFGGAGTTALVSHKLGRNWILSELNSEYVAIAQKRLQPYLNQTTLF